MTSPTIIGKPVILVVDKNPEWMESIDFNLGDEYMVISADDLTMADRMFHQYQPEVMLLDWQIAKNDLERARVGISRAQGLLPVILVTGLERPEVENIADLIGGCIAIVERGDTINEVKREIAQVVSCAEDNAPPR
jgi:DNA-binding response OmpR family regulator